MYHGEKVFYKGPSKVYELQYIPHKIFTVNGVRFYDVFTFWSKSFVRACDETFQNEKLPPELREGKAARSDFWNEEEWPDEKVLRYNFIELDYLVRLGDHLRENFLAADIHIGSSYYGPGAIAKFWLKENNVQPISIPSEFRDVMERGFFGGRFEHCEIGTFSSPYEADINSAYPAVIATLPYLDKWRWVTSKAYGSSSTYSIWLVEWHLPENAKIGPFPSRDKVGSICYPKHGRGWYWKPEVDAALAFYSDEAIKVSKGVAPQVVYGQPLEWVQEKFNMRQSLKAKGDPAEMAYKLGLNSLYGKTAQRVGKAEFFNLAWAGYITSATRAKLLREAMKDPDNVIGFATDAVFFKRKPDLVDSNELGGWKVDHFTEGIFLASGVYKLKVPKERWKKDKYGKVANKVIERSRGIRTGIDALLQSIEKEPTKDPTVKYVKFVTHIEGLRGQEAYGKWRGRFMPAEKQVQPYATTKRKMMNEECIWGELVKEEEVPLFIEKYGRPVGNGMMRNGRDVILCWYDYEKLLKEPVPMAILENHNDHSSFVVESIGDFEMSHPYLKTEATKLELLLTSEEEIAGERLGDDDDDLTPLPTNTHIEATPEIISG